MFSEMSLLKEILLAFIMYSFGAIATLIILDAIDRYNETSTKLLITFVLLGFFFLFALGFVDII